MSIDITLYRTAFPTLLSEADLRLNENDFLIKRKNFLKKS